MKRLTAKEEEIMQMFWEHGPMFVRELLAFYEEPKPHYNTVSTLVRGLEEKGFVKYKAYGNTYQYYAAVSDRAYKRSALNEVVAQYYNNSYTNVVSAFIEEEGMSVDELKALIVAIESKRKSTVITPYLINNEEVMGTFLFYIFQSTLCLTVLYFLFRLAFRKDTLFRTNRFLLLVGTMVCALLPFLQIDIPRYTTLQCPITTVRHLLTEAEMRDASIGEVRGEVHPEAMPLPVAASGRLTGSPAVQALHPAFPVALLGGCYVAGGLLVLVSFALSTLRMRRLIRRYPSRRYGKYRLIVCSERIVSFSWGNTLVLSQEDYERHPREVLLHERMHLEHKHTLDLLWMQGIVWLHWFNPAAWLLMHELREVHEYEADNSVINHGIDATEYQLLLVRKSVGTRLYSMACGFNHSKLKNRITMMLKRRTNHWARLKLLLFVPVAAGTLYAFARPEVKKSLEQAASTVVGVKQDSLPQSELLQLEAFFEGEMNKKPHLKNVSAFFFDFNVNMHNKMMLNQEVIPANDLKTLSARLTDILRTQYRKAAKKGCASANSLSVFYDRGASADAMTAYLRTVKASYLQVRGEIADRLGGASEARLDSVFPILVRLEKPKTYSSSARTAEDVVLPIEIIVSQKAAGSKVVLEQPTLRQLRAKMEEYKEVAGRGGVSLSLRVTGAQDVPMGMINDVKEAIRKSLYER